MQYTLGAAGSFGAQPHGWVGKEDNVSEKVHAKKYLLP